MKTTIIIQARMSSTRLPGKILKKIAGIPTIELIVKRLKKLKLANDIIIATSNNSENKPLINYLKKKKLNIFVVQKKMFFQDFILQPKNINQKLS